MKANSEQLNNLVQGGLVQAYPPLVDIKGSYTAQFEHVRASSLRGHMPDKCVDHPTSTKHERSSEQRR